MSFAVAVHDSDTPLKGCRFVAHCPISSTQTNPQQIRQIAAIGIVGDPMTDSRWNAKWRLCAPTRNVKVPEEPKPNWKFVGSVARNVVLGGGSLSPSGLSDVVSEFFRVTEGWSL